MKSAVVVEDDAMSQKFIRRALEGVMELYFAKTGSEGEALIEAHKPDLIMLDVELPDCDGYSICHELRQKSDFLFTPILFISGRTHLDERIKGYSAGGDDYITKPFEGTELVAKVKAVLRQHGHKQSLANQFQEAQTTAIESMTGFSELGLVVQFFEKTYAINNYDQLAHAMFQVFGSLGLKTCLIFEAHGQSLFFTSEGDGKPIEKEIMERLRAEDRFYDFGQRTQINYPVVACLVKNMPMNDPARYGRYKDVIPPVLASANQKVLQLELELLLQDHTNKFTESFRNIRNTLDELATQMREGQHDGSTLLNDLLTSLEQAMPTLGLDDDQEKYLMESIEFRVNEALNKVQNYEAIQMTFDSLIRLLQHLVDEQEKLVDRLVSKEGLEIEDGPGQKDDDSDVELF